VIILLSMGAGDEMSDANVSRRATEGAIQRLRELRSSVSEPAASPVRWPETLPRWQPSQDSNPSTPSQDPATETQATSQGSAPGGSRTPNKVGGSAGDAPAEKVAEKEGVPTDVAVGGPGQSGATGGEGEGEGPSAERQAAAEALGAPDRQGGVEHPEPLYVAGAHAGPKRYSQCNKDMNTG
jgi:hypothetical protein